jgi:hypothetical protein
LPTSRLGRSRRDVSGGSKRTNAHDTPGSTAHLSPSLPPEVTLPSRTALPVSRDDRTSARGCHRAGRVGPVRLRPPRLYSQDPGPAPPPGDTVIEVDHNGVAELSGCWLKIGAGLATGDFCPCHYLTYLLVTRPAAPWRGGTLRFRAKGRCCAPRVETATAPRHLRSGEARLYRRSRAGRRYFRIRLEHGRIVCNGGPATRSQARADNRDGGRPGGRSGMGERNAHLNPLAKSPRAVPGSISRSGRYRLRPDQVIRWRPRGACC